MICAVAFTRKQESRARIPGRCSSSRSLATRVLVGPYASDRGKRPLWTSFSPRTEC